MPPHIPPIDPPLGPQPLNPTFYKPHQVTLAMKEKVFSLSGDDFTVKTAEGEPICRCKGKVFSVRGKKKFADLQDNEIFTLSNKMLSLHKSFHAESPAGNSHDFEVKGHFSLLGSKSTVSFTNASDGRAVELELKGDWIDKSAEITWEGRPVARISRDFFNVREFFGGQQTYFVTVAANVDLTLIAGMAVALDERENEAK